MKENKNLEYYNRLKECPDKAKRQIKGGRLAGMSDVNPMWRIMKMTEVFGMCGFGWKYEITNQWNESYGNEVKTYCNINLYVKIGNEWSAPIQGTGGSSFVSNEKSGTYVSDENYKMALTDALSVAMKALGMAADVYWEKGRDYETKYSPTDNAQPIVEKKPKESERTKICKEQGKDFDTLLDEAADKLEETLQFAKDDLASCQTKEDLKKVVAKYPMLSGNADFLAAGTARKKALGIQ